MTWKTMLLLLALILALSCPFAGYAQGNDGWTCPTCRRMNRPDFSFCPGCGTAWTTGACGAPETVVSLKELSFFQKKDVYWQPDIWNDSYDRPHSPTLSNSCTGRCEAEFLLNGEYRALRANLYIRKKAMSDMTADLLAQAQITIYGDDRLLYSSPTLGLRDEPMAFSVDVSGVKFLKIVFDESYGVVLGEPVLVK